MAVTHKLGPRADPLLIANAAAKALLVGLLAFSLAAPDLPQFEGKAMTIGVLLAGLPIGRLNAAVLVVGIGATLHTLWELAEYLVKSMATRLHVSYVDTIADAALGLAGSVVAATLTATVIWSRRDLAGGLFAPQARQ